MKHLTVVTENGNRGTWVEEGEQNPEVYFLHLDLQVVPRQIMGVALSMEGNGKYYQKHKALGPLYSWEEPHSITFCYNLTGHRHFKRDSCEAQM